MSLTKDSPQMTSSSPKHVHFEQGGAGSKLVSLGGSFKLSPVSRGGVSMASASKSNKPVMNLMEIQDSMKGNSALGNYHDISNFGNRKRSVPVVSVRVDPKKAQKSKIYYR